MKEREKRYVLLDRDGTVIVEKHYLSQPEEVELIPGAAAGLRLLQQHGFGLVLITNQSGVGRGMFTLDDVARIHSRLTALLKSEGVRVDGIYCCPHAPPKAGEEGCDCRKPRTKLPRDAARDLRFHLEHSWIIGDKQADIELGINCGAKTILVRTGYGADAELASPPADFVTDDLLAAANIILRAAPEPHP